MLILDFKIPKTIANAIKLPKNNIRHQQLKVLKKLLRKARFTKFGQEFKFDEILLAKHAGKKFQELVPIYTYNRIYKEWWHKTINGEIDICWPGKIKYYALSSGTSESSSKYIPITTDLLKGNKIVMIKQLLSLRNYTNISLRSAGRGWLTLGGSTDLEKNDNYYTGDLSGITVKKSPFWFQPFYKPGKKISREKDWNKKLKEIVAQAPNWDIGFMVGVPAWVQMCIEMIIEKYHLNNIHELWPNLDFYVHGGVSFEPYKKGFEKLLGKPITYIETYLASEGFIAYQDKQNSKGMKLVTNQHIFFEFIPFDDHHFDNDGNMLPELQTLMLHEIDENKDYAILISTAAGAWRYLIGDTIKLINKENSEIIISGRTKHFISLVGEHLSVDNMNNAIQIAGEKMNLSLPEFTVAGEPFNNFFAHHWYIACDEKVDTNMLKLNIDNALKELNDDYALERKSALKEIFVTVLPENVFMNFMESKGKVGGQHKFPRVLKGEIYSEWKKFIYTM